MPLIRTPLYEARTANLGSPPTPVSPNVPARDVERDGYLAKLIKYVPAEVVAVFGGIVALAANINPDNTNDNVYVVWVFFGFLALTPAYFWLRSNNLPNEDRPTWYFYILSILAFAVWAVAISANTREALGLLSISISPGLSEFILAIGAFLIPFIDEVLSSLDW